MKEEDQGPDSANTKAADKWEDHHSEDESIKEPPLGKEEPAEEASCTPDKEVEGPHCGKMIMDRRNLYSHI